MKIKQLFGYITLIILYMFMSIITVRGKLFSVSSILFHGSYLINLGQVPYKDFFMPHGPVSMYLHSFIMNIFGTNMLSNIVHIFILSIILGILFYRITTKEVGIPFSLFLSICLFISFYGIIGFPWYNQVAFFFFLLNILLFIQYGLNNKILIISTILTTVMFFTKQDIGLLFFLSCIIYFTWHEYEYKKTLKIFWYYILPTTILVGSVFLFMNTIGDFSTYFNYGQIGASRLTRLFSLDALMTLSYNFWLVFIVVVCTCIVFLLDSNKKQKNDIMISGMILGMISIVSITSGAGIWTLLQGVPIILFLLYRVLNDDYYNVRLLFGLFVVLLLVFTPIEFIGKNTVNSIGDNPSPYYQRITNGCYKDKLMFKESYIELQKTKEFIIENNNSFLVMDSYMLFLYCDFNITPPTGIPLFYDLGVTYQEEDFDNTMNRILEINPKVIILRVKEQQQLNFLLNNGYERKFDIDPKQDYLKRTIIWKK